MRLFINDQEVDITLQGEKNLGDLYLGIKNWFEEQGLQLNRIEAGGQDLDFAAMESWELKALEKFPEIRAYGSHPLLVEREQLSIISEYLILLQSAIEQSIKIGKQAEELGEILEEIPYVLQGMDRYFNTDTSFHPQERLRIGVEKLKSGNNASKDLETLNQDLLATLSIISSRLKEYENPRAEALASLSALKGMSKNLAEVSTQLQTKRSKEALDSVHRMIELLEKVTRCLSILSQLPGRGIYDLPELKEIGLKMNALLLELSEGLENQDVVLVGDILEYELPEVFDEIQQGLEDLM